MLWTLRNALLLAFVLVSAALGRAQTNHPGTALQFDNIDDDAYVQGSTNDFNLFPLTAMAWVKTTHTNSGLINKYTAGSLNGWQLFLVNGQLRAWYFATGSRYVWDGLYGLNGGGINDGRWHHIAFAVDSAGGRLYVDGVLRDFRAWTGEPLKSTNLEPVRFGKYPGDAGSSLFAGTLDEVSIWSVALAQTNIQASMYRSLAGSELNLSGYWRFDEGTGLTAKNLSPSGGNKAVLLSVKGPTWVPSTAPIGSPTVTLFSPTNFSYMAADISARIEPRGRESVTWVQWSTSMAFDGQPVLGLQTNAAVDVLFFTNRLSGLQPGSTIFYRVGVSNSSGLTFSHTNSFLFPYHPPLVLTLPATDITHTSAVLRGVLHTHGVFTSARFDYGQTTNYGSTHLSVNLPASEASTNFHFTITRLTPGQTYHYRLRAAQNLHPVTYGADMQFVASALLPAVSISNMSFLLPLATLAGSVTPNDLSTSARFEYGNSPALGEGSPWITIGSGVSPLPVSFVLPNVVPGQTFYYRIVATNSVGISTSSVLYAQAPAFTPTEANLPAYNYGSAAWGDYDLDRDLDLIIAGQGNTRLLRNDNGNLTVIDAVLPGILNGTAAWGDFNADGWPDLLLCGMNLAVVLQNNTNGTFQQAAAFPGPGSSAAGVWGDFDNDGDLDVALIGTAYGKLFLNQANGTFADSGQSLPSGGRGPQGSDLACADLDGDGSLELVFTGRGQTLVFQNDGSGHFVARAAGLPGFSDARVAVADFDADGAMDLFLTGYADAFVSKIFRNTWTEGGLSFQDLNLPLAGVADGSVAVADFNNDGLPDLAFSGATPGNSYARFYLNDHGTNMLETASTLGRLNAPTLAAGDVDQDGRTDLWLMGHYITNDSSPTAVLFSELYRNNFVPSNSVPLPPKYLTNLIDRTTVLLSWDAGSDAETARKGLTYQVRIGRTPDSGNVSPALAGTDGLRRVATPGPITDGRSFWFQPRLAGQYFWSVQTIDSAFAGSAFSATNSFTLAFPPTLVSFQAPTDFRPTVLSTLVNPNGEATVVQFQWGTTTNYGEASPWLFLGTGVNPASRSFTLGEQAVGEIFHARVIVSNAVGVVVGPDISYTVPHFEIAPVASKPHSFSYPIYWADLDGDGDLDVIHRNQAMLFQTAGGWLSIPHSAAPALQNAVISVSDLRRDGTLDFAASGQANTNFPLQLWMQQGNGFVLTPFPQPLGSSPGVSMADFNNDGRPDLVSGSSVFDPFLGGVYDHALIFRQEADGSFTSMKTNGMPGLSGGGFWGDYNNDGWLDCAGSRFEPGVALNLGGTNFLNTPFPAAGGSAGWADFDNDGWLDLALGGRLYRNDSGTFTDVSGNALPGGFLHEDAKWGDLDGDGWVDLVLGTIDVHGWFSLKFWRNQHDGSFEERPLSLPLQVPDARFEIGGFESGRLHFLLAPLDGDLTILRNIHAAFNSAPFPPTHLAATLHSDGRAHFSWKAAVDAETPSPGLSYNLRIIHPDGSLLFAPEVNADGKNRIPQRGRWQVTNLNLTLPVTSGVYRCEVQAVDHTFSGSTFASLRFGVPASPVVTTIGEDASAGTHVTLFGQVIPMGASAHAWFEWGTTTNYGNRTPVQVLPATFDPAAFTDRLVELPPGLEYHYRLVASNAHGIRYGTNLSFTTPRFLANALSGSYFINSACVGDFNQDGRLDIAALRDFLPTIAYSDGQGGYTNMVIEDYFTTGSMAAADFDRDGFLDLLAAGTDSQNSVSRIWRNLGNGTFSPLPTHSITGGPWGSVECADLNNDGLPDVLVSSLGTNAIWSNLGNGAFASVFSLGANAFFGSHFALADFDRDGDLDIFHAGGAGLWRNEGGFRFTQLPLAGYLQAQDSAQAAWGDYDGDGWPDLAVGSDNGLTLWRNQNGVLSVVTIPNLAINREISVQFADFAGSGRPALYLNGRRADSDIVLTELWSWTGTAWTSIPLPGARVPLSARVLPADLNGDGRLDLVANYLTSEGLLLALNRFAPANLPPAFPTNLVTVIRTNGMISFSWSGPGDESTPPPTLGYALRLGTAPGRSDIVHPAADANGWRQLPNVPLLSTNSWTIIGLPYGRYFWSVQAVDAGLAGGPFAPEAELMFDPLRPQILGITQAGASVQVQFSGTPNVSYGVFGAGSLVPPIVWQNLGNHVAGTNGLFELLDADQNASSRRFYKLTYPGAPSGHGK